MAKRNEDGKYSYAIYIFHPFFIDLIGNWLTCISTTVLFIISPIFLLSFTAFIYFLAFLSWHCFEKHFLDLKKYFAYEKKG